MGRKSVSIDVKRKNIIVLRGPPPKVTDREKRLIKLQQLRDDTASLADLVRYVDTNLNLLIGHSTISRIVQDHSMISYIPPRKPRITPT